MVTRRLAALLALLALVATACGASESSPELNSTANTDSERLPAAPLSDKDEQGPESAEQPGSVVLLAGSVDVPGAQSFNDPGFHEPIVLTGTVPANGAEQAGQLVVILRDSGRPSQTCDRDHPLSGCVTVDWSDFDDRPGVPPGGVFDNRLTVVSTTGPVTHFLSERNGLAPQPDDYSPG